MQHDAWFFVGIFALIFIIWLATGGPTRPLSFTGPALPLPDRLGGGDYLSFPRAPLTPDGGFFISLPGASRDDSLVRDYRNAHPPVHLQGGVFGPSSPYRGLVRMRNFTSGAGSLDPHKEYVEIYATQDADAPVNISGWTIKSDASGHSAIIPKGTEVPRSGVVNASEDIVLMPGNRALLISGRSPIGASFRENKCVGYFSTFQRFYPPLPQNCPVPFDELRTRYGPNYIRDVACIEHIKTIPRCRVTLTPPVGATGACKNFIVRYLNYNGCVTAHLGAANFKGNTWRVYLSRTTPLWRTRYEIVKLIDREGKTVDAFSY